MMNPFATTSRHAAAFLLALGVASIGTMASAQEGPNLRTMTCTDAKGIVKSQGAAILNSGPNVFNRYVRDAAYCVDDQYLQPAWVKTQDKSSCFIGYICSDDRDSQ